MPNLALLPITQNPDNLVSYIEENFRRIAAGMAMPLPSAQVAPGTFPAGNFTFPNNLDVKGRFAAWNSLGSPILVVGGGGAVELGAYIDFHASGNAAEANDYDVRLRAAADWLYVEGGGLEISGGPGTNVVTRGSGAGYEFQERDTGTAWVLYSNAAVARLWRGSDLHLWGTDYFRASVARIGYGGFYGNFACFAHMDRWAAGQYALLQGPGGETYLNAYTGAVYIRWQNNDKLVIDVNASSFRNRIVLNDNRIDTRGWGDDWHCAQWWSGNDGWRHTEYGGFYFRVRDSDPVFEITATGRSKFHKFDQIGAYDQSAVLTHSSGGGTGAKYGYWSMGQNAAHIHKCWGSSIEVRNWDDGNWGYSVGDFNDVSTLRAKVPESIERMKDKLPKVQRREKHKKIQGIKYKRPLEDACVNCLSTGLKANRQDQTEKQRGEQVAASLFGATLEKCPDCQGSGKKTPDPGAQKNFDTGLFGFAAEELAVEFPEVVFFDREGLPVAVKPNALIALLWEDNKDQQEEIDALEARVAQLEKK